MANAVRCGVCGITDAHARSLGTPLVFLTTVNEYRCHDHLHRT